MKVKLKKGRRFARLLHSARPSVATLTIGIDFGGVP